MSVTISFKLSDRDIEHFKSLAQDARKALESGQDADAIIGAARSMLDETREATDLPDFVSTRLEQLGQLIAMLEDAEWQLEDEDRNRVLSAMAYFLNPDDLIPDRVPGIGFLDDAIMIELIALEFQDEIDSFQEFCAYRTAEEQRRSNKGQDVAVAREDWLASKRAALQQRMRKRRNERFSTGGGGRSGWRSSLW
ncbi:MAG: YkvA family protein [Xanthomonadales bacterium]|nr:YkvA family protein [Xanthomonadales bacterium]